MRNILKDLVEMFIDIHLSEHRHNGIEENTSLVAPGALAHRLQRRTT